MDRKLITKSIVEWLDSHKEFKWAALCKIASIDKGNLHRTIKTGKPTFTEQQILSMEPLLKEYGYRIPSESKVSLPKDYVKTTNVAILNPDNSKSVLIPRNLAELKTMCPLELTGFERSEWVSTNRKKYNI